jgi:hypothetical protein
VTSVAAVAQRELGAMQVELEIISMREQVKRTKGHYESLCVAVLAPRLWQQLFLAQP